MQPQDSIHAQLAALSDGLARAERTLKSPDIEPGLYDRVRARFETELARLRKRIEALRRELAGDPPSLVASWQEFGKLQRDADRIIEECLALVHGGLARKAGIDGGICNLTDALLDDLAEWSDVPWGRFTLLATSEFFRDTAEIIRVRYPGTSLWAMPFAAHEFGHFLGPQLRTSRDGVFEYPFQEKLRVADEARGEHVHGRDWYHLQECFADVFATWTLGPSFVAAFVTLRSHSLGAHAETDTHPATAKRVHAMLEVLGLLATRGGGLPARSLEAATERVAETWRAGLRAAGQPEAIPAPSAALVSGRVTSLAGLLAELTPPQLALDRAGWARAEALAEDFLAAAADPGHAALATLPQGTSRRDVLNAAWYARMHLDAPAPIAVNTIEDRARAAYRLVPPRGG